MWHGAQSWYDWIVAHRRDGESVPEAAERIAVTHAYLECRGRPLDRRPYRDAMVRMLKLNGSDNATGMAVHRMIHRYELDDVVLR